MNVLSKVAVVIFGGIPPTKKHEEFLRHVLNTKSYEKVYVYFHTWIGDSNMSVAKKETIFAVAFSRWYLDLRFDGLLRIPDIDAGARRKSLDIEQIVQFAITDSGPCYMDVLVDGSFSREISEDSVREMVMKGRTVYLYGNDAHADTSSRLPSYSWDNLAPSEYSLLVQDCLSASNLDGVMTLIPLGVERVLLPVPKEVSGNGFHFSEDPHRVVTAKLQKT